MNVAGRSEACWREPPAPPPCRSRMWSSESCARATSGPLDYDDSLVPGQIVASIMHLPHVTAREDRDIGLGAALELRLGVRAVARHPASKGRGAVGERDLRRHADERDADAVPAARANPAALAVAARRDGHMPRYPRRLRAAVAAVDDRVRRLGL